MLNHFDTSNVNNSLVVESDNVYVELNIKSLKNPL